MLGNEVLIYVALYSIVISGWITIYFYLVETGGSRISWHLFNVRSLVADVRIQVDGFVGAMAADVHAGIAWGLLGMLDLQNWDLTRKNVTLSTSINYLNGIVKKERFKQLKINKKFNLFVTGIFWQKPIFVLQVENPKSNINLFKNIFPKELWESKL